MKSTATCVVSAADYRRYWQGKPAPDHQPLRSYDGPERRANKHDRRWSQGLGGRRRYDRKVR